MARGSVVKRDDGKWLCRIDVKTPDGKRMQKAKTIQAKNRSEAEKKANVWFAEVQNQNHLINKDITIAGLCELWAQRCEMKVKRGKMVTETRDWYKHLSKRVISRLGHLKADIVSYSDLENFSVFLSSEDVGEKYTYEHFSFLKMIYNYAILKEVLDKIHVRRIRRIIKKLDITKSSFHKKPKVYEFDEVQELLENSINNVLLQLVILIANNTGLRRNEILALKWVDVDFQQNIIHVNSQLSKKGKVKNYLKTHHSHRVIPMTDEIKEVLLFWKVAQEARCREQGRRFDQHIVVNEIGELLFPDTVTTWMRELSEELDKKEQKEGNSNKWQGRTPHTLRHTFASRLIAAGANVNEVSALLGHRSSDFTYNTYIHLFLDSKKEAINKLNDFNKKRSTNAPLKNSCEQNVNSLKSPDPQEP